MELSWNHFSMKWEQFSQKVVHKTLFNTEVYGSESTEILEMELFLFISSDSCHKKMLLESLNIPLSVGTALK